VRIDVHVTPRARRPGVERTADGHFKVRVTAPADAGRANAAVIEALAEHFGVPKRAVTILQGHTARKKLVEIDGPDRC